MGDPNEEGGHVIIETTDANNSACFIGTSKILMTMLRDFGGNQVWIRITNEIFDSEDVLPVADEEDGTTFEKRMGEIIKKYNTSVKTI